MKYKEPANKQPLRADSDTYRICGWLDSSHFSESVSLPRLGACHYRDQSATDAFKWKHWHWQRCGRDSQQQRLNPTICLSTAISAVFCSFIRCVPLKWSRKVNIASGGDVEENTAVAAKGEIFFVIHNNKSLKKWFIFCPAERCHKWPNDCTFVYVLMSVVLVLKRTAVKQQSFSGAQIARSTERCCRGDRLPMVCELSTCFGLKISLQVSRASSQNNSIDFKVPTRQYSAIFPSLCEGHT